MIRILRIAVVLLFLLVSALFAKIYYEDVLQKDNTVPKITVEDELIEVKPGASSQELLTGLTAYDEKDGDITDKIIVESISKFYEPGVCKITYAVYDNDNHVASASRKIKYIGYESPRFSLEAPLVFRLGDRINLSDMIKSTDMIEGDISKNVIVTSNDYSSGKAGIFHAELKVTNGKGDIVYLTLPMIVEEVERDAPQITLKKNLVYLEQGKKFNPLSNVESVIDINEEELDISSVTFKSDVKSKKPGIYSVNYYVTDSAGRRGHTMISVIVSEGRNHGK